MKEQSRFFQQKCVGDFYGNRFSEFGNSIPLLTPIVTFLGEICDNQAGE